MVSLIKGDPLEEIRYLILSPALLKERSIYLRDMKEEVLVSSLWIQLGFEIGGQEDLLQ